MTEPLLTARGIAKSYGPVKALKSVDLDLHAGEVLGLVGDNGAGKSTLAGILSGSVQPTGGTLTLDGRPVEFHSPEDARGLGIEMVFQDLALAPDLTVAQNIFLGREKIKGPRIFGWLDSKAMNQSAAEELEKLSISIRSVKAHCRAFSGGQRQAVAIARAVTWSSKVLLLDEPTAALGVKQQAQVLKLIREAADSGLAVVLISHNMQQVLEVCDRVVVLFQGRAAASLTAADTSVDEVVAHITGSTQEATKEAN